MQISRIIQAVILLTIIALAASCAASKEYVSKVFPVRESAKIDSVSIAKSPRFLEISENEPGEDSQEYITIASKKDSTATEIAIIENEPSKPTAEKVVIANPGLKKDTTTISKQETEPLVKATRSGNVRTKRVRD